MEKFRQEKDPRRFLALIRPFLEAREAELSLLYGRLLKLLDEAAPPKLFMAARLDERDQVRMAAFYARMNLILTQADAATLEDLAALLNGEGWRFPGVIGPSLTAADFARVWSRITGVPVAHEVRMNLYELRSLIEPVRGEGAARMARPSDQALVADWFEAFTREALPQDRVVPGQGQRAATQQIAGSGCMLWIAEGRPVSMAFLTRLTSRGATVSYVYTPPAQRGKGYGSRITAAITRHALGLGKEFCVLYADATNPASNAIYQRLGYRIIGETTNLTFG
jgi:predicted GNAT family acetyltransferase